MERHPQPPFEKDQAWHWRARTDRTLLGIFESMDQAHQAAERLERNGVDSGEISLLGPSGEEGTDRRPVWRRSMFTLFRRLAIGGAIGAVAGAIIGAIFTQFIENFYVGTGAMYGAGAGLTAGSLIGAMTGISLSDAWESSLDDHDGLVGVSVGSEDTQELDRAKKILSACDPVRVIDLDRKGAEELQDGTSLEELIRSAPDARA